DYTIRHEFNDPNYFFGLSINIYGETNVTAEVKLMAIPNVVSVFPIWKLHRPGSGLSNTSTTKAPVSERSADVLSHLKLCDIDRLHDLGIKGKGMKIAIIDTGVDYLHPSLGGGFGPGYKIGFGAQYVSDYGYLDGPDPLATCAGGGHGTHVSGIVGMQDPENFGFGMVGVAPEATIGMYRVFTCDGFTTTEIILRAMIQAGVDGADVVSMSLGSYFPFESYEPFAETTYGLYNQNVAVVAAAGNYGQEGLYSPSSPAVGPYAISIGSVSNTKFPVVYSGEDSRGRSFQYASVYPVPADPEGYDVYMIGTGMNPNEIDDYERAGCDTINANAWWSAKKAIANINKTIIMVPPSLCGPYTMQEYWSGIKYVLQYVADNNDPYASQNNLPEQLDDGVLYMNLDNKSGLKIEEGFNKSGGYLNYKLYFTSSAFSSVKQGGPGLMSNYSGMGPTWDTVEVKPQLSAPGGNILSTWPTLRSLGSYGIISGTSMAAPYAAAAYALVKSQFPALGVQAIRNMLQSTATPLPWVYDQSILSTVAHQGSGLINPYNAINYQSTVSPSELHLGDLDDMVRRGTSVQNITITNKSTRSKTYVITHQGAGYAEYYPYPALDLPPDAMAQGFPQYDTYGTVDISPGTVSVEAGKSVTVEVVIKGPPLTDFQIFKGPVFSGFIIVTNNNDKFSVPYLGVPFARREAPYMDLTNNTGLQLPDVASYTQQPNPDGWSFSWVATPNTGFQTYTYYDQFPVVRLSLLQFSGYVRIDMVPANTTFMPTVYGFDTSVKYELLDNPLPTVDYFLGIPIYGNLAYAWNLLPGWSEVFWDPVALAAENDSSIAVPDGDYRALISVLRLDGNLTNPGDYETWLGPLMR
ncbi:subtilisin-like protein, partial [Thozetella sp. PMI_491]